MSLKGVLLHNVITYVLLPVTHLVPIMDAARRFKIGLHACLTTK